MHDKCRKDIIDMRKTNEEMVRYNERRQRFVDRERGCPDGTWRSAAIVGVFVAVLSGILLYYVLAGHLGVMRTRLMVMAPLVVIAGIAASFMFYVAKCGAEAAGLKRFRRFTGLFIGGIVLVVYGLGQGGSGVAAVGGLFLLVGIAVSFNAFMKRRAVGPDAEVNARKRSLAIAVFAAVLLMIGGGAAVFFTVRKDMPKHEVPGSDAVSTTEPKQPVCDESRGFEWCERQRRCVNPWVSPCDEDHDRAIIQRMNAIKVIAAEVVSRPIPVTIGWRMKVNSKIVQQEIEGLSMELTNTDGEAIDRISGALTRQGFAQDLLNMADGPGSGNWGYQLGSMICVMRFRATNLVLPSDPVPEVEEPLLFDISVSCGRL
jgi:hypothetical protein